MIWELPRPAKRSKNRKIVPKSHIKHLRSKRTTLLSAVYGESRVVLFLFCGKMFGLCSDAVVALVHCAFVNDILKSDAA